MAEKSSLFNLQKQYTFYGSYHTNKVNIAMHLVGVPLIFFTSLILTMKAFPAFGHFEIGNVDVSVTLAFVATLGYATYFILLEPVAGLLYAPILFGLERLAHAWYQSNPSQAFNYAVVLWIACWVLQISGHQVFEGRAPALLDSAIQSLVLAVFFVFLEVLFYFGYKPQLHRELKNSIGKSVLEYRRSLKKAA